MTKQQRYGPSMEPLVRSLACAPVDILNRYRQRQMFRFIARNGQAFPDVGEIFFEPGRTDFSASAIYERDRRGYAIKAVTTLAAHDHGDLTNVTLTGSGQRAMALERLAALRNLVVLRRCEVAPVGDRLLMPVQITEPFGKDFRLRPEALDFIKLMEQLEFEKVSVPERMFKETRERLAGASFTFYGVSITKGRSIGRILDIPGLLQEVSPDDFPDGPKTMNLLDYFGIRPVPANPGPQNTRAHLLRSLEEEVYEASVPGFFKGTFRRRYFETPGDR